MVSCTLTSVAFQTLKNVGHTLTPQVPTIEGPRGSSTLYSRYLGGGVRDTWTPQVRRIIAFCRCWAIVLASLFCCDLGKTL